MPVPGFPGDEDDIAYGDDLFLGLGGDDPLALIRINLSCQPAWDQPGVDRCWASCVGN